MMKKQLDKRFAGRIRAVGYIPKLPENCILGSRHLGLVTAAEIGDLREKLDKIADLCAETLDIDVLSEIAHTAEPLEYTLPIIPELPAVKIAVAQDAAFCFYYKDTLKLFEKMGAELVSFSPLADEPLPADADYEDYAQIENGVGMITSLLSEFDREMEFLDEYLTDYTAPRRVSVATGVAAYPTIRAMAARLEAAVEGLEIHVYEIINHFFGETITVAGLLTGQDIAAQLEGRELGDELIFPCNALRAGETVFLDDMTAEELSSRLGVPTRPGSNDGATFISELLGVDSPVS
jgi:hypothetical protein